MKRIISLGEATSDPVSDSLGESTSDPASDPVSDSLVVIISKDANTHTLDLSQNGYGTTFKYTKRIYNNIFNFFNI
jgi:hypothetical protein